MTSTKRLATSTRTMTVEARDLRRGDIIWQKGRRAGQVLSAGIMPGPRIALRIILAGEPTITERTWDVDEPVKITAR